jgi:hypothetical protein
MVDTGEDSSIFSHFYSDLQKAFTVQGVWLWVLGNFLILIEQISFVNSVNFLLADLVIYLENSASFGHYRA